MSYKENDKSVQKKVFDVVIAELILKEKYSNYVLLKVRYFEFHVVRAQHQVGKRRTTGQSNVSKV